MSDNIIHLPVAEAYDRWSGFYDSYDNPLVFVAGHAICTLANSVAGKAVFEFGCGTGRNLAALKAYGAAHLAGCDVSEGMLAKAKLRDSTFEVIRHDMTLPLSPVWAPQRMWHCFVCRSNMCPTLSARCGRPVGFCGPAV